MYNKAVVIIYKLGCKMAEPGKRGINFRFWRRDLAVDLGTTNTLIYMPRKGIVLQEPSVVALRRGLAACGKRPSACSGAPHRHKAVKPLQEVIADYEMARKMLERFISSVMRRFPLRLRLIITVPYGTTQVEWRAVLPRENVPE